MNTFTNEFSYTKQIIQDAGKMALSYFSKGAVVVNKKKEGDARYSIVTEADLAIEKFIHEKLSQKFPEYGFIGEEGKEDIRDILWIVDPIDGTTPFSRGIPEFGLVISLKSGEEIVFSCIYLPVVDLLYSAKKGEGAFENNKKISVSDIPFGEDSLISIGTRMIRLTENESKCARLMGVYRCRIGLAASAESTYLSSGKIDLFMTVDQPIWDVAAEYLLMKEAGAVITDLEGNDLHLKFDKTSRHNWVSTNCVIHDRVIDILNQK